jgi:hypothetical protein
MGQEKKDKEKEKSVESMRVVRWGLIRKCRSIKEEKNARFQSVGPESVLYGKGSGTRIYDVNAHTTLFGGLLGLAVNLDPSMQRYNQAETPPSSS